MVLPNFMDIIAEPVKRVIPQTRYFEGASHAPHSDYKFSLRMHAGLRKSSGERRTRNPLIEVF